MNKNWLLSLSTAASVAVLLAAAPAQAAYLDARFTGPVTSAKGPGAPVLGSTINGEFVYSTDSNAFLSFTINGISVAPGFTSTAALTPDHYSALFELQQSPVTQGGKSNATLSVDLEGLNPWPSPNTSPTVNALGVLTNASGLATNLDTFASTFSYYLADSTGSNVRSGTADLTSINVSVPEPASLALLATACLTVALRRRRR